MSSRSVGVTAQYQTETGQKPHWLLQMVGD